MDGYGEYSGWWFRLKVAEIKGASDIQTVARLFEPMSGDEQKSLGKAGILTHGARI